MGNVAVVGGPIGLGDEPLTEKSELGVAAPAAKGQEAPPQSNEQAPTKEQIEAMIEDAKASLRAEYEGPSGHLARVRSQLARSYNEREQAWRQSQGQLEDALHSANLKGLNEQERAAYERDLYKEQTALLRDQITQTQAELESARSMGEYVRGLQEGFGIDTKDLNLESVEDLSKTAFTAAVNAHKDVVNKLRAAEDKIKTLELKGADSTTPAPAGETTQTRAVEPPAVTTVTGVTKTTPLTLTDLRRSLSVGRDKLISEEELFEMAENPEQTGVDLNVVLESLRNELAGLEEEVAPQ